MTQRSDLVSKNYLRQKIFRRSALTLSIALILLLIITATHARPRTRATPAHTLSGNLSTQVDEPLPLVAGQSVAREMREGEKHSYQIALLAGQYLSLSLSHQSAEFSITIFNPNNLAFLQSQTRRHSPTRLSLIATSPGTYRIELRAVLKGALVARYEIKAEEARAATPQDEQRILAERTFAEGDKLFGEWKAQSFEEAIKKYEAASSIYHALEDKREEASALSSTGETLSTLGQYPQAATSYAKSLALAQDAGDKLLEIETLNEMGRLNTIFGKYEDARKEIAQAQTLSQTLNYRRGEAQSLNNDGEVAYNLSEMENAVSLYNGALTLWRELGDSRGEAQTLLNLGYVYTDLSDTQKAFDYYNQSLALWRAAGDPRGEGLALTAIGLVHSLLDEHQQALDHHKEALKIFQTIGDRNSESTALNGQGYEYRILSDYESAQGIYERTRQLYEEAGDRVGLCLAQYALGNVYRFAGDNDSALTHFNQALAIATEISDPRLQANALRKIGVVYDSLGDRAKALDYYKKALPLSRTAGDIRSEAETLNLIGYAHETQGDKTLALNEYKQALELRRAARDRTGEALTLYSIAHAERDMSNLDQARSHIEAAIRLIESLRTKVDSQSLRASYFASAHQLYELQIDLLMRLRRERPSEGFEVAAFETSERSRARSLLEMLATAHAEIRQGVEPALLKRERSLQLLLEATAERQAQLLGGKHTDEQAAQIKHEILELTNEYESVGAQIKTKSPRYVALTQPQPLAASEIRKETLDAETLLLEYSLGVEKSYLWAVTPTEVKGFELPPRREIEQAAERFYDLLTARRDQKGETLQQKNARVRKAEEQFPEAAATLSEMLLGRVSSLLGTKRLLIVSDGALQHIPFAALPVPQTPVDNGQRATENGQPLIVEHEIVNLPSASVLAVLRRETKERVPAANAVAVLADPVFDKDDDRVRLRNRNAAQSLSGKATLRGSGSSSPAQRDVKRHAALQTKPLPASSVAQEADVLRAARQAGALNGGNSFERLRSSRREAEAIMALAPNGKGMQALDFDANRKIATGDALSQFRIVHFATHAFTNDERPELSGLVLSLVDENGARQDGFLRLYEVYNLKLPAELVVLSACQTALGKQVKGEGLIGLTRGFMYAGAKSVVASLWEIDDQATAELMDHLYREMLLKDKSPAAALRAAQIAMWNQKNRKQHSPYYWAAFVLQGEWSR